jgi:hypothetical protein
MLNGKILFGIIKIDTIPGHSLLKKVDHKFKESAESLTKSC